MEKLQMIYEGKAKKVHKTNDPDLFVVEYKDDATAFNGEKREVIQSKGILNNKITTIFFDLLKSKGVPTHHVETINDREQVVKSLHIIPVEVVVRNIVAGSLAKRIGRPEGEHLPKTVIEFYYKDDELGDPMINEYHIDALNLATAEQMEKVKAIAWQVNEILREYLAGKNLDLVDFKLEFGVHGQEVLLGDEISPDTCRFWDMETKEKLDKDRFRRNLGGLVDAYEEVLRRLQG